ncbi:unnamed protein product [Rotaria sordida]|uniref:Uncharacterized protein n=1 Tax=Rotaria sordida TaxID=392033 RepID=A0A815BTZ5_9BILA|nr:unnamed protein product [Rotaria sordida]
MYVQSKEIPYDTIVCFGDSNSDTGNVYKLTHSNWPTDPPYDKGISNLINYAYGSATTDNNLVRGYIAFNLTVPGINCDRTIYIIWAGENDYQFNLALSPSVVVKSLINGINDLIQIGAKHFLIVNQPPLRAYPANQALNILDYLKKLTLKHNHNLSNSIQLLQTNYSNISIKLFDVYSLITNILINPSVYGITSTKTCWNILDNTVIQLCSTPDTYLYIDGIHFTTRIHQLIADNARKLLIQSKEIPHDTIVCFGDSNSDTGNVYKLTGSKWPIDPPYYKGRFSNGKVWIEKLGISNLMNYAYGGATTDNNLVQGFRASQVIVPGVRQQIAIYKNTIDLRKINFHRTIYIIWVGENDYQLNLALSPSAVVKSLINGINDLIEIGAKHFLIVNQSPLQAYPANQALNIPDYLKKLTLKHNHNLSNSIRLLQLIFPKISFKLFDVYSLITNILINPSTYGINSTTNCWSTPNYTVVHVCSTPDTCLFIDEYHFTTRIHQLIADNARELLVQSKGTIKFHHSIFSV